MTTNEIRSRRLRAPLLSAVWDRQRREGQSIVLRREATTGVRSKAYETTGTLPSRAEGQVGSGISA